MTIQFRQFLDCPNCGHHFTSETEFCRWMRNCPQLDSWRDGIVRTDADHIIHRYKFDNDRNIQAIMMVEVKTHGAIVPESQRDTLLTLDQVIKNRTSNMHKKVNPIRQIATGITRTYSRMFRRKVWTRVYGVYLLTFSGTCPDDSPMILWNKQQITTQQLIQLFRFELDPDTLAPIDVRDHHKSKRHQQSLNFTNSTSETGDTFISLSERTRRDR